MDNALVDFGQCPLVSIWSYGYGGTQMLILSVKRSADSSFPPDVFGALVFRIYVPFNFLSFANVGFPSGGFMPPL